MIIISAPTLSFPVRSRTSSIPWFPRLASQLNSALKLNHFFQTTHDVRRDFATNGDEISHREPKVPQGLFCPAVLLGGPVGEELNPVPCKVRDYTG